MEQSVLDTKVAALKENNKITLSRRNIKLGEMLNFSLVCGETCPGKTKECTKRCYAAKYEKAFPSTEVAYYKNLGLTLLDPEWMQPILKALAKEPEYFRIHTSGDFYGPKYIQDWYQIVKDHPKTHFLAFTRSWRLPRLRKELNNLRKLPNIQVIASLDVEAHDAPEGWRVAWMGEPVEDKGRTIMCPGYGPQQPTCDKCGICFKALSTNVWFPIH